MNEQRYPSRTSLIVVISVVFFFLLIWGVNKISSSMSISVNPAPETILIGIVQGVLSIPLAIWGGKFLRLKHQYAWSAILAVAFTIGLTMFTALMPIRP